MLYFVVTEGSELTGDLFLCGLTGFDPEHSPGLNCSKYCGVVYGNAECLLCSSKPICTDSSVWDYSSCIAGVDEITFQLNIQTEDNGDSIRWKVRPTSWEIYGRFYDGYANHALLTEFRCVEVEECYNFTIFN